jgi:hypothetical protein
VAAKKAGSVGSDDVVRPRGGLLRSLAGPGRWVLLLAVLAAAAGGLWFITWDHVRDHVFSAAEYRLDPRNIEVTPPPPWIRTDVKAEVIRNASLDAALSVLDENLTVNIAQAFALHPWVAKVTRVSKHHPARVEVEVVYRQPVVMVEVSGGLLPVDGDGVLLPSDDFSPAEARKYPRLSEVKTVPIGPQGTRWGDARVAGGAKLAALLMADWQAFKLARIVPTVPPAGVRSSDDTSYELVSQGGTRILWGHAPGSERAGDPSAADKLERLKRYLAQHGSFEAASGAQVLDVRGGRDLVATPRTAIKPLAPLPPRTAPE